MRATIYVLRDPDTDEVRYCGATTLSLGDRLRMHVASSVSRQKRGTSCKDWVNALVDAGRLPRIEAVAVCSKEEMGEVERAWIARLRDAHPGLLNVAAGGPGASYRRTSKAREVIRTNARAMWESPEIRAKMLRGFEQANARPEVKAKRSASSRARAAEHSAKMKAHHADPVVRANNSAAQKAAWADPEKRARRLAGQRSAEARAKNSAARKAYFAANGCQRLEARILTFEDAQEVRRLKASGTTYVELSKQYGLTPASLCAIVKGRTYRSP